jgi:hypothetical protein
MLQAAVAVNTALNAADCFGLLPVRGTKLNISGNAKVGSLETDEIRMADEQTKALEIKEGANAYMTISTVGAGAITLAKPLTTAALSAASVSATGAVSGTTVSATGAISAGTTVSGTNIPANIDSFWRTEDSFAVTRYEPGLDAAKSRSTIFGATDSTGVDKVDSQALVALSTYLAGKAATGSLTVAESTQLFGQTSATSQTSTIEDMAGATIATSGLKVNLTPQFLTGDITQARDTSTNNKLLDGADVNRHLIIFSGNTFTSTGAAATRKMTIGLHGTDDDFDASAANVLVKDANGKYISAAVPDGSDTKIELTASAANVKIEAGSFIYIEGSATASKTVIKAFLNTSGPGTLGISYI